MRNSKQYTRRSLLLRGVQLSAASAMPLVLSACSDGGQTAALCVTSDSLSQGELSLRDSAQYVDVHEDVSRVCAGCSFFKPGGEPACGHCDIFNGQVSSNGYCTSWNAKSS